MLGKSRPCPSGLVKLPEPTLRAARVFFSQERDRLRQAFLLVWQKMQTPQTLTPLEKQIAQVLGEHPEYNRFFAQGEGVLGQEFPVEEGLPNPFMHLSMHLALRDQIQLDRPLGIAKVFKELTLRYGHPLEAEHRMMDALAEALWFAQQHQQPLSEAAYLQQLQNLLQK